MRVAWPLFAGLVFTSCNSSRDATQLPPDWRGWVARAEAAPASDQAFTRELQDTVLAFQPSEGERADYVRAALHAARRLRSQRQGDPYRLLVRAESFLPAGRASDSARLELAEEYVAIALPWRAARVLSGTTLPAALAFAEGGHVRGALEAMRSQLAGVFRPGSASELRQQLIDLLAVRPLFTSFVDPAMPPDSTIYEYFVQDQESFDDELGRVTLASFLLPVLATSAPRSALQQRVDSEHVVSTLTARQDAAVRAFADVIQQNDGDAGVTIGMTNEDLEAAFSLPDEPASIRTAEYDRGTLLLVVDGASKYFSPSFVITAQWATSGWSIRAYEAEAQVESAQLREVDGDAGLELFIASRAGSGGFYSASVFDVESGHAQWRVSDLPHGETLFANLDLDAPLELLVKWKGTGRCGQCVAPIAAVVYDRRGDAYVPLSQKRSHTHFMGTGSGTMGVTPTMYLDIIADSANRILREHTPSREDLGFVLGEYYQSLVDANQHDRAASVMYRMVDRLRTASDGSDIARTAAMQYLHAQLRVAGPEGLLDAAQDSAIRRIALSDSLSEADYYNLVSVAAMLTRDVGRAFEALQRQRQARAMPQAAMLGNLAYYYLQVNALTDAERAAYAALEAAYADDDARHVVIDYLHLATIALARKDLQAALDWAARAIAAARGSFNHNLVALAFHVAANVALEADELDVGRALMDEAMVVAPEPTWSSSGASMLLTYGRTLLTDEPGSAVRAFHAGAAYADRQNSATLVDGKALLSRVSEEQGDAAAALTFAREALNALTDGRQLISSESHKLSFIADRRAVVERYLRLALAANVPAAELQSAAQAFKFQVFLDLHRAASNIRDEYDAAHTVRALRPDEVLVDYFIGDSVAIALVGRSSGWEVRYLHTRSADMRELITRARAHFDVTDAVVIRDIRRKRVPQTLQSALHLLHEALIEPLGLPSSTRNVIISPDETLYGVPWGALLDSANSNLIDRTAIAVLPSFQLLSGRVDPLRWQGHAVLIGAFAALSSAELRDVLGPVADTVASLGLPALRNGSRELRSVGEALRRRVAVRLLVDTNARETRSVGEHLGPATKSRVVSALRGASIVHVAAHGVFLPQAPMRSTMLLSGKGPEAQILATDFMEQRLDGLQLITLGACRTAENTVLTGSEPLGMLRGLFGAGVESAVLAEWNIDDSATADLFTEMYANIGVGRAAALRAAQLAVRQRNPHPYFWAGLTLYGAWR